MDIENSKLIKKPIVITIIYWFMVISGIFSILRGLIIIAGIIWLWPLFGSIQIIMGILLIGIGGVTLMVARGLKEMKKLALIILTVITEFQVFSLAYIYFTSIPEVAVQEIGDISNIIFLGIQILVLIYLWNISEKFA
jgi:hypothetical protein